MDVVCASLCDKRGYDGGKLGKGQIVHTDSAEHHLQVLSWHDGSQHRKVLCHSPHAYLCFNKGVMTTAVCRLWYVKICMTLSNNMKIIIMIQSASCRWQAKSKQSAFLSTGIAVLQVVLCAAG